MKTIIKAVYLDVCSLGRPYDDQSYSRIEIETIAVIMITSLIKSGKYMLYYSPVHLIEIRNNTNEGERIEIVTFLNECGKNIAELVTSFQRIERRSIELINCGFGIADAFHVANAEYIDAAFITCDDNLIRKCTRYPVHIWNGTPVDFCKKEGLL